MPLQASVELLSHIVSKVVVRRDSLRAERLICFICSHSLQGHSFLGNHLVTLAEAVHVLEAQCLFDALECKNEAAWNALVSGYSNHGDLHAAFSLYDDMQKKNALCPDVQTLVALLKACSRLRRVEVGIRIHKDICEHGWHGQNVYIGSTLVDMYAKCGFLAKAHEVFDLLSTHNVFAWTSLIGGYIEHEKGTDALQCFDTMQRAGIIPDAPAFVLGLKACGMAKAKEKGQEIHAEIERLGLLDGNSFLGSALVGMYIRCEALSQAFEVAKLQKLQCLASWNALISGLAEWGHGKRALDCFEQMQQIGIPPNVITLTSCVKACTINRNLVMGQGIHSELERLSMLEVDTMACNALIDMHMKCGRLSVAHELFHKLSSRTIVSWNSLITGYVERGHGHEALDFLKSMRVAGVAPNDITLASGLKACSLLMDVDSGLELHAEIESKGFLCKDTILGNSLIHMYAKCGSLSTAQKVFDKLRVKDATSWNVLIGGYTENGYDDEALKRFEEMERGGMLPNPATFVWTLKACSNLHWEEKGLALHAEIERRALLFGDVANAVVHMYIGFGFFANASEVFRRLPFKDEKSWNALLVGFAEHGHDEEVIKLFESLQLEGLSCNTVTFVWSLKSCINLGAFEKGQHIHAELERLGWLSIDPDVSSVLIDMYIEFGLFGKAKDVFSKVLARDVVLWTVLISGYTENDQGEDALECYKLMQGEGIFPNDVTLLYCLKACSSIGAADTGRELHIEVERKGLLEKESLVGNCLVDMYASCGLLTVAKQVFEKLPFRTVVSWTALMTGYAQLGLSQNVFQIYEQMLLEFIKPDQITFVVMLNTCSRKGLVDQSNTYFDVMSKEYGIVPTLDHHYCILDLFCRTGDLEKAEKMISKHLPANDLVPWHTILSACKNFGNLKFGRHAFLTAMLLDSKDAASYALMTSILSEQTLNS